jgi:hypothetical protein
VFDAIEFTLDDGMTAAAPPVRAAVLGLSDRLGAAQREGCPAVAVVAVAVTEVTDVMEFWRFAEQKLPPATAGLPPGV